MSSREDPVLLDPLTGRELEVLGLIADGLSNREIAQRLVISPETVKWYAKQIYSKLGVGSRTQAIAQARDLNLFEPPVETPSPATPVSRHNLPAQVSSFIGRERQITEVGDLLKTTRLLTLTGPGGTGKTRLAIHAAARAIEDFPGGVYFVGLASLSDPALVPKALAHVLGVTESAGAPLDQSLVGFLSDRQILLLLDNFEHLLAAAPLVSDLLSAAPGIRILVTSREVLHLYGEHEYAVLPLSLPDDGEMQPAELLATSESVALYVERAQAARSDFMLTDDNAGAISEICRRLDGLPLAIELAAARVKLFTPEQLLDRLDDRLGELTGGSRDLPSRQRTLRDTIDWSYELLDAPEREFFARLGVFRGGSTLEAAHAVCGENLALDVVDGVASLMDKSLLRQQEGADGEIRFRMLETIREYALERLEESGQTEELRAAHAEYYAETAELAAPELRLANHPLWSKRLEAEHDNLRAALTWSLGSQDILAGLRIVGALRDFWYYDAHYVEGWRWIEHALDIMDDAPPEVRARVLQCAAWLDSQDFDHPPLGIRYAKEALGIYRELGDQRNAAWATISLAMNSGTRHAGKPDAYADARALAQEGLAHLRAIGDKPGIAQALNILGEVARANGDYERAEAAYEECLEVAQLTGESRRVAMNLANLGYVLHHKGHYERAVDNFLDSLSLSLEIENAHQIADALSCLVGPVSELGEPARAVRLAGAADSLYEQMQGWPQPTDKLEFDRYLEVARAQLDEAAFESAWAEGRAMSQEEAIAYAFRR